MIHNEITLYLNLVFLKHLNESLEKGLQKAAIVLWFIEGGHNQTCEALQLLWASDILQGDESPNSAAMHFQLHLLHIACKLSSSQVLLGPKFYYRITQNK